MNMPSLRLPEESVVDRIKSPIHVRYFTSDNWLHQARIPRPLQFASNVTRHWVLRFELSIALWVWIKWDVKYVHLCFQRKFWFLRRSTLYLFRTRNSELLFFLCNSEENIFVLMFAIMFWGSLRLVVHSYMTWHVVLHWSFWCNTLYSTLCT